MLGREGRDGKDGTGGTGGKGTYFLLNIFDIPIFYFLFL